MNSIVTPLAPLYLIGASSFLQVTRTAIKSGMGSKFGQIRPQAAELAALGRLEKSPWNYNRRIVVTTLVHSFSDGSSSFLHIIRTPKSLNKFEF